MTMNGAAPAAVPEVAAWSADVFVGRDRPAARPVLEPLLARAAITLLTGPRGIGKSWLALSMAHAAARGGTLAGWRAREAQRVVYLDAASGEALLQARLAALAPAQPRGLVLAPGDAQIHGLPDVASESGRAALDRLVAGADLVVLDGIAALVQAGRGVGARWAALAHWLRALRRRGLAVLLVETSEPRALAALADTVLRLERPADASPGEGVRFTLRVAASRALAGEACRCFGLHLALREGGAAWTRRDEFDHQALAAWRLHERDFSTREIARKLGVSPATAWRLVERGEAMPEHLRDREELPELEEERRREVAEDRAEARRKAERRARLIEQVALQEAETAARRDPHPPPSPASGRRSPSRSALELAEESPRCNTSEPSPACGRGQGEGRTAAAVSEAEGAEIANSPEAVKQAPASLDEIATDEMLAVFLARRRSYRRNLPPPSDGLAKFAYEDLACVLRSRLTGRVLNRKMLEDDTRGARPPSRAQRLWRTPQALLPHSGVA